MQTTIAVDHYKDAVTKGKKNYQKYKQHGESGKLPSLEGLLKEVEIVSTVPLGLLDIPLKKVVGTYTEARKSAFSRNFMPLQTDQSDFKEKWIHLCAAHLDEGIRDPIKVYEYMNWFYVVEGNKRVSVLKYFDAWSIQAEVIRLVPKRDHSDMQNTIYYEFQQFFKETRLISIWFSKQGRYKRLLDYLSNYNPKTQIGLSKFAHFERFVYYPFRRLYYEMGGNKLSVTTGDAFILFARVYGIPDTVNSELHQSALKQIIQELGSYDDPHKTDISMKEENNAASVMSTLGNLFTPQKKLRVAFVYARNIENSGWTYSHDQGRQHVADKLADRIITVSFDNIPEDQNAYEAIKEISSQGFDVIFTTSEIFMKPTLRCALEHPKTLFFNCSENRPYLHLSNYFGRTYEPRFLSGIIAGSMTESDIIGYTATHPTPEVIAGINAFTLGARMVNPRVEVLVMFTESWNDLKEAKKKSEEMIQRGADIVNNKNHSLSREDTWSYGIYSMLCKVNRETGEPKAYLASPIWRWGIYYEKILNNVVNGTYKSVTSIFNNNPKLINFWWGMASGVIDLYASTTFVPRETRNLVNLMKEMIVNNRYHPFKGPIYDVNNKLRIQEDAIPDPEYILKMDWFVQGVKLIIDETSCK